MSLKLFCPRPFEQFYVTADGLVHSCCPEWTDGPIGNLLTTDPFDIWRGAAAEDVRDGVLDGSFHHCIHCPFLPGPAGCVHPRYGEGRPDTRRIKTFTIAYDPTCNLRCRSCRTEAKTFSIVGKDVHRRLLGSEIFKLVDTICTSGAGDPLAALSFWELLGSLDPFKLPYLRLYVQTNGLLFNELNTDRLRRMGWLSRVTDLSVSVDASYPETYRQVRGGNWGVLMDNLARAAEMPHVRRQLNFVVQETNFHEMVPFVALARRLKAHRVSFSALDNWGTFAEVDYLARAVHLPGHPRHAELLEVLGQPELDDMSFVTMIRLPRAK